MRIIALIATFNEERFIAACIENYSRLGVEVYLLDNDSTDRTVEIARRYLDRGLVAVERLPRYGVFDLAGTLERKEQLAASLDADWFMHADADEIRLPPPPARTFAEALAQVERAGFNAVNFMEFTFMPTVESPDHDHPDFQCTMRGYYPFLPRDPHRLNLWKRQLDPVDLRSGAGHWVQFDGLRMNPRAFPMRHYLALSLPHAIQKYVDRRYAPAELERGWHYPRSGLRADALRLPPAAELRVYTSDEALDPSNPRARHYLFG